MPYLHDDESGVPLLVPTAAVLHDSVWVLCADRFGHALWLHGKTAHEVVDLTALREQGEYQVGSTQVLGDPLAAFLGMLAGHGSAPRAGYTAVAAARGARDPSRSG